MPTFSGPNPARTPKYKPDFGPNPKTNLKPKSCPKNPKVKLDLKILAMLPRLYFCALETKSTCQAVIKPKIFVSFRPEPGPNPTQKAWPDLQLCAELVVFQYTQIVIWKIIQQPLAHKTYYLFRKFVNAFRAQFYYRSFN